MGWDNQGNSTGDQTYGPLCYDTVAPTITISNSPVEPASGWWNTSVQVTLSPADSGGSKASGIYKTYYAINSTSCVPGSVSTCSVYNGPFAISGQQQSYIYYFTEDNAGNFSAETYEWVSIDLTPCRNDRGLERNKSTAAVATSRAVESHSTPMIPAAAGLQISTTLLMAGP